MPGFVLTDHQQAEVWMAGQRLAEATPSYGQLCPAITNARE